MAAVHGIDTARWRETFEVLMGRIASRFARVEPRREAREFVLGLLAGLPRKNCWTLAEHAGHASPDRLQHLLARAKWDADAVRDDLRGFVVDHLGTGDVVLVVDETGDLKKGTHTVGVQRQYTGTARRAENSQVAVYLAYSTPQGHAAIDRELYVPRSWTDDPDRCRAAGIPEDHTFARKPQLAARMIDRALAGGITAAWVTGDEAYGDNTPLRDTLEQRGQAYALAVARNHRVTTRAGQIRANDLVKKIPKWAWQKLSAGAGAKGHRHYDWALAMIEDGRRGHRHLLVRRNRRTGELACYRCYSTTKAPLATFVRVAGRRWTIEETFQSPRPWPVSTNTRSGAGPRGTAGSPSPCSPMPSSPPSQPPSRPWARPSTSQFPLTRNEIQHLFTTLVAQPRHTTGHRLRCSHWRRWRQARADACHYQRQATQPT